MYLVLPDPTFQNSNANSFNSSKIVRMDPQHILRWEGRAERKQYNIHKYSTINPKMHGGGGGGLGFFALN